jgi:hypothetical protein
MSLRIGSGQPPSGSRELDAYVSAIVNLKYVILGLALLALVIPPLIARRGDYVAFFIAASLIGLAYIPTIGHARRASSVRALLLMLDGILSSFAVLMVVGIWNMARYWAHNYWLYEDYLFAYAAAYAIEFAWLMSRSRARERFRNQVLELQSRAVEGVVTAADLYRVLVNADEQRQTRGFVHGRAIALIVAPLSVGFLALGAVGGGDYFLYACFLIACLVSPILLGAAVCRRLAVTRYFGQGDIMIRTN